MPTLRTTIEYLWGKSYSKDVFNKSTLLKLMREQLNFRQKDIQWGKREGRSEGRTEGRVELISALKLMLQQEDKITKEKLESFLKRMEEEDKKQKSSTQ